jgi:aryl-alcohol dehydrogenase
VYRGKRTALQRVLPLEFQRHTPGWERHDEKGDETIYGSFFSQSSFATHLLAGERNVVPVSKEIPLEVVAPLGCGVQTGAGAVMNSLNAEPGSAIAVFGVGTVGMSAILAAMVCGCTKIIAVDIHAERLELARQLGATTVVNASEQDPVSAVKEASGGGVNYSLECVGNPKVFRQAVDVLAMSGVCGLIGVVPKGTEVSLDMELIMNGRRIMGIIEGDAIPDLLIPSLLELYQQGRFPIDKMLTFYTLDEIEQAVEDMEKGTVVKPVLKP